MTSPVKQAASIGHLCETLSVEITERIGAASALIKSGHTDRALQHLFLCEQECKTVIPRIKRLAAANEKSLDSLKKEADILKEQQMMWKSVFDDDFDACAQKNVQKEKEKSETNEAKKPDISDAKAEEKPNPEKTGSETSTSDESG